VGGDSFAGELVPNCCSVLQIASGRCPLAVDAWVFSSCRFISLGCLPEHSIPDNTQQGDQQQTCSDAKGEDAIRTANRSLWLP
jgi:hypothetical protein